MIDFNIRNISAALMIMSGSMLSGCSIFDFGESDYKCSGMPQATEQGGIKCVSARKVYELTEQPGPVLFEEEEQAKKSDSRWWGDDDKKAKKKQAEEAPRPKVDLSTNSPDPLAASPINNDPMPIRSRAKIMRIWVAPWESTDGDLHVSGLVFTELEGRRWNIGVQEERATPSLTPLQVIDYASKEKEKAGGKAVNHEAAAREIIRNSR